MRPWASIAASTWAEHQRFLHGLRDCEAAQKVQLAELLSAEAGTALGIRYDFGNLVDPDEYRSAVPLSSYDDLAADIRAIAANGRVSEPVVLFEETSGSSGCSKLIPYTQRSLEGFQRAVHPWLHDLADWLPNLGTGYFAISPATRRQSTTPGGVPIGSDSDAVYFGAELIEALHAISAVPDVVARATDIKDWQRLTLLYLLRARDLTFLSVWSPTFLTALLGELPQYAETLLRDLHDGLQQPLAGAMPIEPDPARAALVSRALDGEQPSTSDLWPKLLLVSTWTHGSAARFVSDLQGQFPHAEIQGKGLLATEGVVSVPLREFAYPVLAVNSGFFEFLDDRGQSHLAHETLAGNSYEVVMSVPGLYRYRNGDRVRVHDRAGTAPQLEFIGRGGLVSDLAGEKLSDAFVCDLLQGIRGFAMLAPVLKPLPHYLLFLEDAHSVEQEEIETSLMANPQYAYARALGQLGAVELAEVDRPLQRYQAFALEQGLRLGDLKPTSLRPETDWEARMLS